MPLTRLELRATSGDRIACAPVEAVATCGEPVTLVVMTQSEDVLASFATTYECLFAVQRVRGSADGAEASAP